MTSIKNISTGVILKIRSAEVAQGMLETGKYKEHTDKPEQPAGELELLTIAELKEVAKERNIEIAPKQTKDEIIATILGTV